jgi:thymidylate synthase (FAD)
MEVETVASTANPDEVVFRAARQDYCEDYVYNKSITELLDGCKDDTISEYIKTRLSHEEFGVIEHPTISFGVSGMSREVLGHLTRHRHFTLDVQSMRYADFSDGTFVVPESLLNDEYANRNGEVEIEDREFANEIYRTAANKMFDEYSNLVEMGVPKEDARKLLPIATTVNLTVSGNARTWLHFLSLRLKFNAQNDTREFAEQVEGELREWFPTLVEWYEEHEPLRAAP